MTLGKTLDSQIAEIDFDNPDRRECRLSALERGMWIWADRLGRKDVRPIGVWLWVASVATKAVQEDRRYDRDTIKRVINELANPRYFYPTPFVHLQDKYPDVDPYLPAGETRYQSSYVPNPVAMPHFKESVEQAIRWKRSQAELFA